MPSHGSPGDGIDPRRDGRGPKGSIDGRRGRGWVGGEVARRAEAMGCVGGVTRFWAWRSGRRGRRGGRGQGHARAPARSPKGGSERHPPPPPGLGGASREEFSGFLRQRGVPGSATRCKFLRTVCGMGRCFSAPQNGPKFKT